ncbi:MAG: anti-sigma factor [Janthinobacterium lividum]
MNIEQHETLVDRLAAEYTLGTLKGGARRRFEKAILGNAAVRRAVAQWHDRLQPLAEFAAPVAPSPAVWTAIQREIGLQASPAAPADSTAQHSRSKAAPHLPRTPEQIAADRRAFWQGLRNDLSFWRGLGMVSTAAALVLVSVLLTRQLEPIAPLVSYVAMLADDRAQPTVMVVGDAHSARLTIKLIRPQTVASDKSLELWAVPKQGNLRSLGLLAADGSMTLALPADVTPATVGLLAVTVEPKGGSPDPKGPTGPIVFKGAWLQI